PQFGGVSAPQIFNRRRSASRVGSRSLAADIKQLGLGVLFWLRILHLELPIELRDPAARIIEIAADDRLNWTNNDTRRLVTVFNAMRAIIALGSGIGFRVKVQGVVGARLHARLATNASRIVKINNTVGPLVERSDGADFNARRIFTMIAPLHAEMP